MTTFRKIFLGITLSLSFAFLTSCSEDIDTSNRYTFVSETMADYLENRPNEFSHITAIYKKAKMLGVLDTYGTNTLFCPTNKAIERFLFVQDSIYKHSSETGNVIETGIHSPYFEDLLEDEEMVTTIAKTHLIPQQYKAVELQTGAIKSRNYNNREIMVTNQSSQDKMDIVLENMAKIVISDEVVENGVIHIIDNVIHLSTENVCKILQQYPYFSIFRQGLEAIGFEDMMLEHEDLSYDLGNISAPAYDANKGLTARYPFTKFNEYTIFAPTNEVFAKYDIYGLPSLISYAEKFYGKEQKDNYTHPDNALYKFITYHILDMSVSYDRIVMYNMNHGENFNSEKAFLPGMDRYDYFTTMQGTLMKVTRPLSDKSDEFRRRNIYINVSNKETPVNMDMTDHLGIRILNPDEFLESDKEYEDFNNHPKNGIIHPIDGILIYDNRDITGEMKANVFNERMRFDFASILPELTTNGVRFISKEDAKTEHNAAGDIFIPDGYSKNLKYYNDNQAIHYLSPFYWGCNLWGDEFIANGQYDFAYRLPPVPDGFYELRIGYTPFGDARAITQFYVNDVVCGIPVDLRIRAYEPGIGWVRDDVTEDDGLSNDKAMRNRGYMKAPDYFTLYSSEGYKTTGYETENPRTSGMLSARDYDGAVRYIVTTQEFKGNDNWFRMKKVDEIPNKEGMHDYFELVPTNIVNSIVPEDRY